MNTYDIAKRLGVSPDEALRIMREKGIFVFNPEAKLNDLQLSILGIDSARNTPAAVELPVKTEDERFLEKCVVNNLLFVDCCSLLVPGSLDFLTRVTPHLIRHGQRLVIPSVVVRELDKLMKSKEELRDQITTIKHRLNEMIQMKLVLLVHSKEDAYFADPVFLGHFHQLRFKTNILLVTQDIGLTIDALNINHSLAARSRYLISVCRVEPDGYLRERRLEPNGELFLVPRKKSAPPAAPTPAPAASEPGQVTFFRQLLGDDAVIESTYTSNHGTIDQQTFFEALLGVDLTYGKELPNNEES